VEAVADLFGVSFGTVVKCTHRVIRGLRRIAPFVIRLPNAQQRAEQAMWAGDSVGFDSCIGVPDGTAFLLAYQPALHPWTYHDRNGRYSLNTVLTCDCGGYIIIMVQGCTGAAPDTFVKTPASWHRFPAVSFSAGQYLLGDKGMKYSPRLIGPYLRQACTTVGLHATPLGGTRGARRTRRLTDAPSGSQNALTTPEVAPSN